MHQGPVSCFSQCCSCRKQPQLQSPPEPTLILNCLNVFHLFHSVWCKRVRIGTVHWLIHSRQPEKIISAVWSGLANQAWPVFHVYFKYHRQPNVQIYFKHCVICLCKELKLDTSCHISQKSPTVQLYSFKKKYRWQDGRDPPTHPEGKKKKIQNKTKNK